MDPDPGGQLITDLDTTVPVPITNTTVWKSKIYTVPYCRIGDTWLPGTNFMNRLLKNAHQLAFERNERGGGGNYGYKKHRTGTTPETGIWIEPTPIGGVGGNDVS